VIPCSYFIKHLDDQSLSMNHHQFRTSEIKAISKPLIVYLRKTIFTQF
jgi:hypothetical protein